MKFLNSRKGFADQIQWIIIPLVAVGIVLVIGFLIMAEVGDQVIETDPCATAGTVYNSTVNQCCTTVGCDSGVYNTTNYASISTGLEGTQDTVSAMATIPDWLAILVITAIGALLIGIVSIFRRR